MHQSLFGTDGIRGRFGLFPFTIPDLIQLGNAIGSWAVSYYKTDTKILIGRDTRISSDIAQAALQTGLLLHPVTIHDAGIIPIPALAVALGKQKKFTCAFMISASHNPYHDNGIKILDAAGKLSKHSEQYITDHFYESSKKYNYDNLGKYISYSITDMYIHTLTTLAQMPFLHNKKIVLDCAHGATYQIAVQVLQAFDADIIALNTQPNGININDQCGAPNPDHIKQAVIANNADVGFAFDGDGDRVIAVNKEGVIKNGDDLLALLLQHPKYHHTTEIVGTLMTNQAFELYLQKQGKQLIRTAVGDKHIIYAMSQKNLPLGGEPSGHIIIRDYLSCSDGLATMIYLLESMYINNNWDMTTFDAYPQIHTKIIVKKKRNLSQPPLCHIIDNYKNLLPNGRLIVRYSGTEPVLRVMIEEPDVEHAHVISKSLIAQLDKVLS